MLSVTPIPAFSDNYIWLLRRSETGAAAVIDPGDDGPVRAALQREGLRLSAILVTHHHYDHIGGIEDLLAVWPEARVFAPMDRRIPLATHRVGEGDLVEVPDLETRFRVMEVPGHTASHVAYLGEGLLFPGDTLFAGGCGRVFDGTFEQLAASLERISALPPETLIYCAHEYTQANLGFAAWVEPESPAIAERIEKTRKQRGSGRPTLPSTLSEELATNPFLRTGVEAVRVSAEAFADRPLAATADVFTALRRWKDERYD